MKVLRGLWGKPRRDGWKRSPGDSDTPTHPLLQFSRSTGLKSLSKFKWDKFGMIFLRKSAKNPGYHHFPFKVFIIPFEFLAKNGH